MNTKTPKHPDGKEPLHIQTCKFIDISDIVPNDWKPWFFGQISQDAPFSWGDNNRTLVSPERFREHYLEMLDITIAGDDSLADDVEKYQDAFLDILSYLEVNQIYIDLEN